MADDLGVDIAWRVCKERDGSFLAAIVAQKFDTAAQAERFARDAFAIFQLALKQYQEPEILTYTGDLSNVR